MAAAAPMFPYMPINQLLSIAGVPANELENCQSGPITQATPRLANLNDNPLTIANAILFCKTWRESVRVFRVLDVVVGIPMSADWKVLRVPKYDVAVFGVGTTTPRAVSLDRDARQEEEIRKEKKKKTEIKEED